MKTKLIRKKPGGIFNHFTAITILEMMAEDRIFCEMIDDVTERKILTTIKLSDLLLDCQADKFEWNHNDT